jgi:hypothetical protein
MTKEQVQNIQDAQPEEEEGRERSTIQFPYNDLNGAIEIAKAISANAGTECTLDQLAAYLDQSMTSGAFRLRVSAAATFGLTENERGSVKLTTLGRRIADPTQESAARADAFLTVPLYLKVYENFKGYTLPGAAAIEKYMKDVGVSSKQLDKARQVFMRSARQGRFFEHGEDRLVKPATPTGPGTPPVEDKKDHQTPPKKNGGGGDDPGGLDLDPLLIALLKKIPTLDKGWPAPQRIRWFRTFAMNVSQIYDGDGEPVEMKIELEEERPRSGFGPRSTS